MKEDIKKLRELTGFGIIDCKRALDDSLGNLDKAISSLKEKGAKILEKKSERQAKEGLVDAYVHFSQSLAAMVEVNCETDFVARSDDFKRFVKDLSMHIAAVAPKYVSSKDVSDNDIDSLNEEEKAEYYKKNCLLNQPYVKDNSKTIADYLNETAAKFRENIVIRRFVRFSLGNE